MDGDQRSGESRSVVLLTLFCVLALVAALGQAVIYFGEGGQPSLNIGMPAVIISALCVGLAYGITGKPFRGIGEVPRATVPQSTRRSGGILTFALVELVVGEVLGIAAMLAGTWPSGLALAAPLLYGGFFALVSAIAGTLIAQVIVWPIAELVLTGERALRGRPVNQRLVAVSLALLTIVTFAILLGISTHVTDFNAVPRVRGLLILTRLFVDYSGGMTNQIESWIARGLVVVLAGEIVWALRAPGVSRSARQNRQNRQERQERQRD